MFCFSTELPVTPTLTLSSRIIEGKDTWADSLFKCEGEIGYPKGYIEVQSDFDGEFSHFLSKNNSRNDKAYVYNSTLTRRDNCTWIEMITFAFNIIELDYHLHELRCVVHPSKELISGEEMVSEVGVIRVVKGKFKLMKRCSVNRQASTLEYLLYNDFRYISPCQVISIVSLILHRRCLEEMPEIQFIL